MPLPALHTAHVCCLVCLTVTRNQRVITPLNLDKLQMWVAMGRLDSSQPITLKHLYDSNVCGKFKDGVKLLATVRVGGLAPALLHTPIPSTITHHFALGTPTNSHRARNHLVCPSIWR